MSMRRLLFFIVCSLALIAPLTANAVDCTTPGSNGFVPLACYQGSVLQNTFSSSGSLPQYLNNLFSLALTVGAMAAVLRLVWAGYLYMGSDIWAKKDKAKQIITDTIIGLLLLLGIYLILFQINPCILNLQIKNDFGSGAASSCPTS